MTTLNNNFDSNAPIGFFDSGVGGLTVLDKVRKILPNEDCIYFGDTAHMPYGEKSKEQLLEYSDEIFKFFEKSNCKAVVMACNTTSSTIYNEVKDKYNFKLYPIVQSVAKILSELDVERLGIFATRATIESGAYQREIAKYNPNMKVFGQHCPHWVHIVEENSLRSSESVEIIKSDLDKMLENNPEKIVLGCTHYPFLTDILSEFAPREMFIDPAVNFANKIKEVLEKENLLKSSHTKGFDEFYVSSNSENFKTSSKMFYNVETLPTLLNL